MRCIRTRLEARVGVVMSEVIVRVLDCRWEGDEADEAIISSSFSFTPMKAFAG